MSPLLVCFNAAEAVATTVGLGVLAASGLAVVAVLVLLVRMAYRRCWS